VAKKSPRLDDNDVALTRAQIKIAELEARVTRTESDFEVLQRRILSLEAREAAPQQLTMTQHEYIERHRQAHDRYSAFAQAQMQAQQQYNHLAQQGMLAQQAGMLNRQNYFPYSCETAGLEEYIRNCTPGRAEVLRRQG
jgi:chromosome segregation ATPase